MLEYLMFLSLCVVFRTSLYLQLRLVAPLCEEYDSLLDALIFIFCERCRCS